MKRRAFTLIELLVVIAIIAILATAGFVVFGNLLGRVRDTKRKGDVEAIAQVLENKFNGENGTYTPATGSDFENGATPTPPGGTTQQTYTITYDQATCNPSTLCSEYLICAQLEAGGGNSASTTQILTYSDDPNYNYPYYCVRNKQGEKLVFAPQSTTAPVPTPTPTPAPTPTPDPCGSTAFPQNCSYLVNGSVFTLPPEAQYIRCTAPFSCDPAVVGATCRVQTNVSVYTAATGGTPAYTNVGLLPGTGSGCTLPLKSFSRNLP